MLIQEFLDIYHCVKCKQNNSIIGDVLSENYGIKNCFKNKDYSQELELLEYIKATNQFTTMPKNYIINDYKHFSYSVNNSAINTIYNFKKEYTLLSDYTYKVTIYCPEVVNGVLVDKITFLIEKTNRNDIALFDPCYYSFLKKLKLTCEE
jgi:hypothetical protein